MARVGRNRSVQPVDLFRILEDVPAALGFVDETGRVCCANRAALAFVGRTREEVLGVLVVDLFASGYSAAIQQHLDCALSGIQKEFRSTLAGGIPHQVDVSFTPYRNPFDEVAGVICSMRAGGAGNDISQLALDSIPVPFLNQPGDVGGSFAIARDARHRTHEELHDAFLVRLDDEIRSLSDPAKITHTAVELLCEHLHADRCSYAEINTVTGQVDVIGNYSPRLPSIVGRYPAPSFGLEFFSRMSAGRPHVFRDARLELTPEATSAYEAMNIAAIIAMPILKDGRLVAGLGVHQSNPRDWRADEIQLVEKVANRCWESIERGRIERALRASEEQFRTLADAMPNLAWMAHSDGYIFWYNRRWYDYTGTSPEQVSGWGWQKVHDPAVLPRVMKGWERSIESGDPFESVFPLRGANGQFRSFLTRMEPIKDSTGRVLRWFGTNTDITVQQEAERREKDLRHAAELLNRVALLLLTELDEEVLAQRIIENGTEAVGAEFGAFLRWVPNTTQETLTISAVSGIDREHFSKLPLHHIESVFAGLMGDAEGIYLSDDLATDPLCAPLVMELAVRSCLAVPVKSRAGTILAALIFGHTHPGIFREKAVSLAKGIGALAAIALDNALLFKETRRSGEALQRINEDLSRANDDLKQFAYSASHDLREPLRMVSLFSQALGKALKDRLSDKETRQLDYILKGATRMEALIRDLLLYTQMAANPGGVDLSCDAEGGLRQAMANLSAVIEETGARIHYSSLPRVGVADVHLVQLFQNLVGNALKYRSQRTPEVDVTATWENNQWCFAIADNGIGIDEEYTRQIFGIFKRLHTDDEYSGTGIGLAICQRIVQHAGGRIWVESKLGVGSTFFFTLPPATGTSTK